jgi:hypothetical protein
MPQKENNKFPKVSDGIGKGEMGVTAIPRTTSTVKKHLLKTH